MSYNNKKVIVFVIYCSPSQSTYEFDSFISNFEIFLNDINKRKPSLSAVTGDFNSRSSSWWSKDTDTIEGLRLFSLTSSNGFSQLINEQHSSKQIVLPLWTEFSLIQKICP